MTGLALCCASMSLPDSAGPAAAIDIRVERDLIAVRADDAPVGDILGLLVAYGLVETEAAPALASPDPDVREEAVLVLADRGDPDMAVHLISRLDDESPEVREAVETALEDLGATHLQSSGRLTGQVKE